MAAKNHCCVEFRLTALKGTLRCVRPAVSSLLDQPLWRAPAAWPFLTPVNSRFEPDCARRDLTGGRIATANRAADAPPRVDQRWAWRARCLEQNRPGWRPGFGRGSTGLAPAQQTHDLGLEEAPPHRSRRERFVVVQGRHQSCVGLP